MTQFWSVNYICQICKIKLLFSIYPKFYLLQLFLDIFYHRSAPMHSELYFWVLSGDIRNCRFLKKMFWKSSYIYLFFIQKSVTSITHEWLVVKSCPTCHWITFLVLEWLIYSIPYHDLTLPWSAVLQECQKVSP